ncbi:MAG: hypothetical protein L6R40_005972 [Gallowayella cf. fulva]|nr:MAG: hypothetical protein L6R40_005972 [Xanthomendoza cf. fulva]
MVYRGRFITCLAALSSSLFARAAVPSPKAATELICHTNHASDCYPQTFQPTENFQHVHDDQNLPPGLHVRMNLATGVKEARLNLPQPDEDPAFSALTIIDHSALPAFKEADEHATIRPHQDLLQQPFLPPQHDIAESTLFSHSTAEVKNQDNDKILSALTSLEDLSHSYHWGLSLAKDGHVIHKLFQLLLPSNISLEVRSLATLVFGTAIHNNQAALTVALAHFYNDEWPEGPLEAVILALLHEQSPIILNRMMFLLSSLCQDKSQLKAFMDAGGVDLLMQIYDGKCASSDDNRKLRKKVTNFVLDHLVPTDMLNNSGSDQSEESDIDAEWTIIHLQRLLEERQSSDTPA